MANTPYSGKYSGTTYYNPGDNIDYKTKRGINLTDESEKVQKQWYLDKAKYLYSSYFKNDTYIPYSNSDDYEINRLYAQGRQPVSKYQELLTTLDKKTGKRKGWMNISWDVLPILPKFRNIVLGKFEDIDYNIMVRAVDEASNNVRDDAKMMIMIENKYGEILQGFRSAIGMDKDPALKDAKLPYIPKTVEELEMMTQLGAFKLSWEIAMDKLLNDTYMKNNWPELKRRLMEDALDIGVIAIKDYQDPQTKLPMCRYVDPLNLIIRQTRRNDYYDVTEAGEIVWYSLEQLRSFGLPEEDLTICGNNYQNMFGNASMTGSFGNRNLPSSQTGGIKCAVLDLEFQSFDRQFYEARDMGNKTATFELPHGTTKPTNRKNKLIVKEKPKYYRCKWIIGTDVIFDFGLQHDVPYKQRAEPRSSYSCYRINDRSIINQCISVVDDFQMKVYKLRNAIATSRPAGIMVEFGSIGNISQGGEKLTPFDVLKIFDDRGDLLFRQAINPQNGMVVQGGIPPITPLSGGVGPYLDELIRGMEYDLNNIREISGLNAIVDASTPQSGALVGTSKIAEAATNHSLRPILYGYKSVKQRCFANLTNRWQIVAKFYPQTVTVSAGSAAFETIRVANDLYEPLFDVYCDAIISDDDKMKLENALALSMQAAKTGSIGITMMDYFYIQQLIATGNMRWAWVYLSYREAKMKQDAEQAAAQSQAQIGQQTQALEAQKFEQAVQMIRLQEEEKRQTLQLEYQLKMQLEQSKPRPQPSRQPV